MLVTALPGDIFSPTQDSDVKRQKEADNPHAESWSIIIKVSPTWSWALVDCAVDFCPTKFINVEIIGCTVQLKSSLAPFGSAVGGELVLKAKVLTMTQVEPETESHTRC
ncbi:hypothetical protein BDZ45DRAFT_772044 [Acephala macrosclerotiorum]|nr:hypothetical protein BDZ45DRAFT_772044 [Acephala macrosclerotiorum]